MNRSPKILAGEEVGNETPREDQNLLLSDEFGSRDNNNMEMLAENLNRKIKIEVIEVEPIFCDLDNGSEEENDSYDYVSAFKSEDDQDSDIQRELSSDFRSNEMGCTAYVDPDNISQNQHIKPPILYVATLDPLRTSPGLQMPVLTIATKDSPASRIPELKSPILDSAAFEPPGLGIHASTASSSLEMNSIEPPALAVSLLYDGPQEIIESELETSVKQMSVSESLPLPVFPDLDCPIDEIAVNFIGSNIIMDIEENPEASYIEQFFGEPLQFNDFGIDSNNNEGADEPDPALIQLMSMTLSQSPEMSRKYATASQSTRNTIRDKFKIAFANMDKNCDVYDAEMLRLLKLYPLELVPEEILNYYMGSLDDY